jgi:hypothetical protein
VRGHGITILAEYRFTPTAIDGTWTVGCSVASCRRDTAIATFPTYGAGARVDRSRGELGGPAGGYRLILLDRPAGARLNVVHVAPQSTDPLPGPTLAIRFAPGRRLRVRIVPIG